MCVCVWCDTLISSSTGGRDKRGGPVLSLVHPTDPDVDVEALMEMVENDFIDMISYFTFVPR